MKRIQKLFVVLVGMLALIGCDYNSDKSDIHLNNGEKWKVNREMKPHIAKGNELLNEFVSQKNEDHHELAENLKQHNNAFIHSCTMKDRGHDELHKWLHGHIELIEKLTYANHFDEAKVILVDLQHSFEIYYNHFE